MQVGDVSSKNGGASDLETGSAAGLAANSHLRSVGQPTQSMTPAIDCIELDRFVGTSPAAKLVRRMIRRLSGSNATTVIEGATGTGKDIVALLLHKNSPSADGPLVPINCAAIPESMIEGELFGYEKGAFSSAVRSYLGKFGLADGGTLFLDEIGELSASAQAKVLRALESGEIFPLGSNKPRRFSARIIAATNRDLAEEVKAGRFRADLYFRLAVIRVKIPPLDERRCDIEPIAQHLLEGIARKIQCPTPELEGAVLNQLEQRCWPGNVRELRNALEHAVVVAVDPAHICLDDLPEPAMVHAEANEVRTELPLDNRAELVAALKATNGCKSEAARRLKISRATLYRRLESAGLNPATL